MKMLLDAITNPVLLVSMSAWLIAQIIKFIINAFMNKSFSISRLWGDGGMPSAHSATVFSLACMCGFEAGFGSVTFALSVIFAIVVMHDASGVRREAGKQAVAIKSMVQVINEYVVEKDEQIKTEKLKVLIGHTNLQVFCGAILGLVISLIYYFALKPIIF